MLADDLHLAPPLPRHRPLGVQDIAHRRLDPRPDRALAAPQIVAEPGDHQRHVFEVRAKRRELVDRHRPVARTGAQMHVFAGRHARRQHAHARYRVVAELRRTGDHRHRADRRLQLAHHAAELHADHRNAVAERRQRQPLEHQVAEPAIGRRVRALLGLDQRVRVLRLRPPVEPQRHAGGVEQLPVRPDPAQPMHDAFAQPDRERGRDAALFVVVPAGAFGARILGRDLLECGGPDDIAAQPAPAIEPRDRRALGRSLEPQVAAGGSLRLVAKDRVVDRAARKRPKRAADGGADRASDRAANHLAGQR